MSRGQETARWVSGDTPNQNCFLTPRPGDHGSHWARVGRTGLGWTPPKGPSQERSPHPQHVEPPPWATIGATMALPPPPWSGVGPGAVWSPCEPLPCLSPPWQPRCPQWTLCRPSPECTEPEPHLCPVSHVPGQGALRACTVTSLWPAGRMELHVERGLPLPATWCNDRGRRPRRKPLSPLSPDLPCPLSCGGHAGRTLPSLGGQAVRRQGPPGGGLCPGAPRTQHVVITPISQPTCRNGHLGQAALCAVRGLHPQRAGWGLS